MQQYGSTRRANTKQLTPNYIDFKIKGNNPRNQKTIKVAKQCRLKQELKFLYHPDRWTDHFVGSFGVREIRQTQLSKFYYMLLYSFIKATCFDPLKGSSSGRG
jgi:hypothetical protein